MLLVHKKRWGGIALNQKEVAMKVSIYTITVNSMLSIIKLIAGIVAHSGAMISDAVHTASDVFSTIVVMIGVTISAKEADEKHHIVDQKT